MSGTTDTESAIVVRVRYFAGARAVTGIGEEQITTPAYSPIAEVLRMTVERHGEQLARVLSASSLLLNGIAVHNKSVRLSGSAQLDVLPPFAGG